MTRSALASILALGALLLPSCTVRSDVDFSTFQLKVEVSRADGSPLLGEEQPMCLDLRGQSPDPACRAGQEFRLRVTALDGKGAKNGSFDRYVRVDVHPGTVVALSGDGTEGRNVKLTGGESAEVRVRVQGAFGPTRLSVEDIGYDLDASGGVPACANGLDDDGNGLIDYPADPGCAFPNDASEGAGTGAIGLSPTLWYAYPTVADVQGYGAATPFQSESVTLETRPARGVDLVVVRVSAQGMFVTDVSKDGAGKSVAKDYGSLYVFNFAIPPGVRVCDRVTFLAGTMSEFYGYTELSFPSYGITPWVPPDAPGGAPCPVPEPFAIDYGTLLGGVDAKLEKVEAGLVRVKGAHVAKKLGGARAAEIPRGPSDADLCKTRSRDGAKTSEKKYEFSEGATSCDLDGSGGTNFDTDVDEAACVCWCFEDPECAQWESYKSRGNVRLIVGDPFGTPQLMQVNGATVSAFDPVALRGQTIPWITGTLATFSGGQLNWTIEPRCSDDVVFCPPGDAACAACPAQIKPGEPPACQANFPPVVAVDTACVKPRTEDDNDAASN